MQNAPAPITAPITIDGAVVAEVRYIGDKRLVVFADGRGRWVPDMCNFEAIEWYVRLQIDGDPSLGVPRRTVHAA